MSRSVAGAREAIFVVVLFVSWGFFHGEVDFATFKIFHGEEEWAEFPHHERNGEVLPTRSRRRESLFLGWGGLYVFSGKEYGSNLISKMPLSRISCSVTHLKIDLDRVTLKRPVRTFITKCDRWRGSREWTALSLSPLMDTNSTSTTS